jgi:hypothetical protein
MMMTLMFEVLLHTQKRIYEIKNDESRMKIDFLIYNNVIFNF